MAKLIGCGNTTCKWNNVGECKARNLVLGANGACLVAEADIEKSKRAVTTELELQKIAAVASKEVEELAKENEVQARRAGF